MNLQVIFAAGAILLYAVAAIRIGGRIARGIPVSAGRSLPTLMLVAVAVGLHGYCLYRGIYSAQGLRLGFFNALSLIGWVTAAMLVVAAWFKPVINLGVAMFPGAAVALLLMMVFPASVIVDLQGGWPMKVHVLSSLLAYSLFAAAAVQVVLLAMQDKSLRRHKAGGYVRAMPPLQTMESLLFQMLGLGFIVLSFSLVTGAIYITDMFAQHLAHKTVLSLIAWLVFAILLWGRWQAGWRGRTTMLWTLGGFALLALAYPATKFILEIILQR